MVSHQPNPMAAVKRAHRIVDTLDRPLARPASSPASSPGIDFPSPPAVGVVGAGFVAVCPGARSDMTTRRSLAEHFGLHVVSVSVGVGVALSTSTWLGLTTLADDTV